MAKTETEVKSIETFCDLLTDGCFALGAEIVFTYNNELEKIKAQSGNGEAVDVNVNMSSTRAVLIDLIYQLNPDIRKLLHM